MTGPLKKICIEEQPSNIIQMANIRDVWISMMSWQQASSSFVGQNMWNIRTDNETWVMTVTSIYKIKRSAHKDDCKGDRSTDYFGLWKTTQITKVSWQHYLFRLAWLQNFAKATDLSTKSKFKIFVSNYVAQLEPWKWAWQGAERYYRVRNNCLI